MYSFKIKILYILLSEIIYNLPFLVKIKTQSYFSYLIIILLLCNLQHIYLKFRVNITFYHRKRNYFSFFFIKWSYVEFYNFNLKDQGNINFIIPLFSTIINK